MLQKIKDEHKKTGETLSFWQEYTRLSDSSSLHLQRLRHQWEELLTSQQDTQAMVHSVQVSFFCKHTRWQKVSCLLYGCLYLLIPPSN